LIFVDTSIWIELLNGRLGSTVSEEDLFNFATCGPVVQEVLQGLRDNSEGAAFREAFLALPVLSDPLPVDVFKAAVAIYHQGRSKGYTIRSSVDCLIAAIAIEHQTPVWHKDRDFNIIARYTALRTYKR
jgi:predicted nucleic acid-binding protein